MSPASKRPSLPAPAIRQGATLEYAARLFLWQVRPPVRGWISSLVWAWDSLKLPAGQHLWHAHFVTGTVALWQGRCVPSSVPQAGLRRADVQRRNMGDVIRASRAVCSARCCAGGDIAAQCPYLNNRLPLFCSSRRVIGLASPVKLEQLPVFRRHGRQPGTRCKLFRLFRRGHRFRKTTGFSISRGQCSDKKGLGIMSQLTRVFSQTDRLGPVAKPVIGTGGQRPRQIVQCPGQIGI